MALFRFIGASPPEKRSYATYFVTSITLEGCGHRFEHAGKLGGRRRLQQAQDRGDDLGASRADPFVACAPFRRQREAAAAAVGRIQLPTDEAGLDQRRDDTA